MDKIKELNKLSQRIYDSKQHLKQLKFDCSEASEDLDLKVAEAWLKAYDAKEYNGIKVVSNSKSDVCKIIVDREFKEQHESIKQHKQEIEKTELDVELAEKEWKSMKLAIQSEIADKYLEVGQLSVKKAIKEMLEVLNNDN